MKYDIIVVGATGFTGQRTVRYLLDQQATNNMAICARNATKIDQFKKQLNVSIDSICIDLMDGPAVEEMVQQAKLIISTAGPYALYGENVVKYCAKHGVDYLDITGESSWVAQMIAAYQQDALASGARLISFCGFDCIPADVCVYTLEKNWTSDDPIHEIQSYYTLSGGGVNGGTLLSALNMVESGQAKQMGSSQLLLKDLDIERFTRSMKRNNASRYNAEIGRWVVPFFMSDINSKLVYRSIAKRIMNLESKIKSVTYSECLPMKKRSQGVTYSLGLGLFGLISLTSIGRKLVKRFGPKSNEGPSEDKIENGYFKIRTRGRSKEGHTQEVTMSFQGDAGNKATCTMLCAMAILVLKGKAKGKGFLTPTEAMGEHLIDQLKHNGFMFK